MANMAAIRVAFLAQKTVKQVNDDARSTSHEESLLYKNDITNSQGPIKNIDGACSEAISSIQNVSRLASSTESTLTSNESGYVQSDLATAANGISTAKGLLWPILTDVIQKASLEVFTEKNTEYDTNNSKIEEIISEFSEWSRSYDAEKKDIEVIISLLNTDAPESTKAEYRRFIEVLKKEMEEAEQKCEGYVEEFKILNEKNTELLEKFLKKS